VHHGQNEFVRGKSHINGIESFWSYAKIRLVKFRGLVSARTPFGHPAHAHLARRRIHTWPPRASLMWPASQGKRAA